jgi:EAL domain-containing protein (putative c-di-GMP-specific phosphodiesterase class I)
LAAAIDDEALEVRFQPKVELATNRLIGAEALVRWFTTAEGEITPDEFIPLAEETGLVIPLGRSVLTRACRAAASWPDGRAVAVNLSPVQLERDDVVATVEHALAASGLDPHRLELEITENVLMHDVAHATAVLRRLRELGVKLALDDFGTGYSSLNMVWRLPLDTLKLDRAFVHALDVDPRTVDIVAGILAMARRLDLDTVAEGVETSRQREILRDLGCRLGQGFLFGPARAELDCAEPLSLPRARA